VVIPRFIRMRMPLLPLKPMVQLQCGVYIMLAVQVHPLTVVILRFIQLTVFLLPLKPMVQSQYGGLNYINP
ncbi:hypothetical protein, partial [uncultured Gammaproteobacteria bacterium]